MGEHLGAIAAWSARNAKPVLAGILILVAAGAVAATRLPIDSGVDTLVDRDSEAVEATDAVRGSFGEDPIVVLAQGELTELLRPPDLLRLMNLEACIAGNVPEEATPLPGPCRELAELQPAQLVSGPATFLNQAAAGIGEELSSRIRALRPRADRAARRAERRALRDGASPGEAAARGEAAGGAIVQSFLTQIFGLAGRFGFTELPSLTDPGFVSAVVFDPEAEEGEPKARLSYLFPARDAAQIVIRLRPDLTEAERRRAIELIRAATREREPRERCAVPPGEGAMPCFALDAGEYAVSGAPVVIEAMSRALRQALIVLLAIAVAVMGLTLLAVFRSRYRLLPLGLALAAASVTFGGLAAVGGRLTIASIAVFPILFGLAVDYAIQLQARQDEAEGGGATGAEAAREAARLGGPIVGTACLATAAGFLVLLLSPTPMVRDFGLLLAVGVLSSYLIALVGGSAALSMRRVERSGPGRALPPDLQRALVALAGARDRSAAGVQRFGARLLRTSELVPWRILGVSVLIAALGWAASSRTEVVTEIAELAPQGLEEVRDLNTLQEETGVSGEIDVVVESPDLADPELVAWMASLKRRVLDLGGYDPQDADCDRADICPGPSLTDFIDGAEQGVSRERVRDLIAVLPPEQLRGVIAVDDEASGLGGAANLAFMIRLMPLDRQQRLIEAIRAEIERDGEGPALPADAVARVGGLPVIAAEASADMESSRYWLTLAGILAVGLVLIAIFRSPLRVLLTLTPILLATGWSAAMLAAMSTPLNPVSAVLGVLVVAIGTEFSVILSSRFRQQRRMGEPVAAALGRTYARTGAAVVASGITVIAGFAVLAASDVRMLREFGLVTVVDLGVALAGVLLLLPAVLVLGERFASSGGAPDERA